jgi:hypothetical protein
MKTGARSLFFAAIAAVAFSLACSDGTAPEPEAAAAGTSAQLDADEVARLRALGYAELAPALPPDANVGVVIHDRERTSAGLSLFTNVKFCSTQLIDMDGNVLHTWSNKPCHRWHNAVVLDSGELLAVVPSRFLLRLDWQSDVVWKKRLPVHHDVELAPHGRIMAMTHEIGVIPEVDAEVGVRDHQIALLNGQGRILQKVSLWNVMRSAPDLFTLQEGKVRTFEGRREIDLFHSNSVEWIRVPELIGTHPIYAPDSVLICIRNQDTLAIFDWKREQLLWAWGQGELSGPHDATLLRNGHILAFDNGLGREISRVVEVDPLAREIVWEYRAPDPKSFYSEARGGSQRLRNGNTLITESNDGRAFEVTPDGDIVWEFINPNMSEEREPSVIVRMRRYEGLTHAEFVERIKSGRGLPARVD